MEVPGAPDSPGQPPDQPSGQPSGQPPGTPPSPEAVGPAAASAPPGWYPDGSGHQRWWDGTQWGVYAPAAAAGGTDPRTLAMLAHLLGILTGFIGPLVIYLINGEKDLFVRHHAAESLNFQITLTIAAIGSFITVFLLVGFILFPLVVIGGIVLQIIGAMKANAGEWWRYPVNLRLVPGAQG